MIPSFLISLIMFIPAFIANPAAVIFGGKFIIDRGKTIGGKRIFGDHKTLSGLLGGTFSGIVIGLIINYLFLFTNVKYLVYSENLVQLIWILFVLSFFSMIGDLIGSFIKRRMNRKPGEESLFLDQYPFALVSLAFSYILIPSVSLKLFPWEGILAILIVTPLIHRGVNILGYKMKMKDVPY